MTVSDISVEQRDGRTASALQFADFSRTMITVAQMAADSCIVLISSLLSLGFAIFARRHADIDFYLYFPPTVGATVVLIFSLARSGVYDVFNTFDRVGILKSTISSLFEVMLLLTGCLFVLKVSDDFSRLWLMSWSMTSAIALCGSRLISVTAAKALIKSGRLTKNIAIVGASEAGQQLATKLVQEGSGTRLIGLFDQRHPSRVLEGGYGDAGVLPLSTLDELLSAGRVDEVVIAIPPSASDRVLQLSRRFHPFPVAVRVLAPAGYEHFRVLDSCRYGDVSTFRIMSKPLDDVAVVVKWLEDKVIASFCLLVVLPLMLVIALSIKLDSPGPVFFRQKRLGANNLPFDLLKFRSMYVEYTDQLGHQLTRAGDFRVTRVGRFLRRTSMDELPQLINVLRGDMSVVGPRPHALAANAAGVSYARAVSEYLLRHRVKPGITGWAQVKGWRGETTRIEQIRRRVEHDLHYIENWSLAFDLLILIRTLFIVMSRENAV
jgi:Undecaprenyl-phosphate glucose phosphotransferase